MGQSTTSCKSSGLCDESRAAFWGPVLDADDTKISLWNHAGSGGIWSAGARILYGHHLRFYLFWDLLVAMGPRGYLGVFASEMASSASILILLPAHNYAMAITLDPFLLGLAGGIGAGLGEITGYLLGKAGKGAVTGGRWYTRFQSMAGR